jgi:hypothetical protein
VSCHMCSGLVFQGSCVARRARRDVPPLYCVLGVEPSPPPRGRGAARAEAVRAVWQPRAPASRSPGQPRAAPTRASRSSGCPREWQRPDILQGSRLRQTPAARRAMASRRVISDTDADATRSVGGIGPEPVCCRALVTGSPVLHVLLMYRVIRPQPCGDSVHLTPSTWKHRFLTAPVLSLAAGSRP